MPINALIAQGTPDIGTPALNTYFAAQQNQRRNALIDQQIAASQANAQYNQQNALMAQQKFQAAQAAAQEQDHARQSYVALTAGDRAKAQQLGIPSQVFDNPDQLKATTEAAFATAYPEQYAAAKAKEMFPASVNPSGLTFEQRMELAKAQHPAPRPFVFSAQIEQVLKAHPEFRSDPDGGLQRATDFVLHAQSVKPEPGGTGQTLITNQLTGGVQRQPFGGTATPGTPPVASPVAPPMIAAPGNVNAPDTSIFGGAAQIAGVGPKLRSAGAVAAGIAGLGDWVNLANDPNAREYMRQKAPLVEKQVAAALAQGANMSGNRGNSSALIKQYQEDVHIDNKAFDDPVLLRQRLVAIRDQLLSTRATAQKAISTPGTNAQAFKNAQDTIMSVDSALKQIGVSPTATPGNVGTSDPEIDALVKKYLK